MKTLFNRKHSNTIDMGKRMETDPSHKKNTVSTLLVPDNLFIELPDKFPSFKSKKGKVVLNVKAGLKNLLSKYRGFFAIGFLPFGDKAKLTFQKEGLNLQEIKFRPDEADWAELGIIAYGLGVSRCWLFSFMLELDSLGFDELLSIPGLKDVVTTPAVSRPQMTLRISGRRRYLKRILHFRI